MGSFIHQDRIAEKLEIARTLGLLTNYVISPIGPAERPLASVTVWPTPVAADPKAYLVRLLEGLVTSENIAVTPAVGTEREETAPEAVAA